MKRGYVLRLRVDRARELLGTVSLVQDIVRQTLEIRKVRAVKNNSNQHHVQP